MDQVQEEQAIMREETDFVKRKIDQILETMLALVRREVEICVTATARNVAPVEGPTSNLGPSVPVPNPVIYGLPSGFTHPLEGTHVPLPVHTSGFAEKGCMLSINSPLLALIRRSKMSMKRKIIKWMLQWPTLLLLRIP